jgi:biotin transport system substrate-specific component
MSSRRTRDMTVAALLAALLAASAYIALPTAPVPVTFQVLVVILAALLLAPGWAAASVGLYLLMGAAGLPVFAGPKGGLGALVGPTGGFLVGFLVAVVLASAARAAFARRSPAAVADTVAALVAIAAVYVTGWAWLAFGPAAHLGAVPALAAGVLPFLPVDALKAVAAVAIASAVRRSGVAVS